MSQKANPTAVGFFVTGALIFIVSGVILLGTGKLFETRRQFVIYFQSSANGLMEGSDVLFGGVKIGSVVKMLVDFDPETKEKVVPVVVELSADRLARLSAEQRYDKKEILSDASIQEATDDGLRAQLKQKSALTGQLFVDLNVVPLTEDMEDPRYLFPGEPLEGLMQMPSVKGDLEVVFEKIATSLASLGEINLKDTIDRLNNLLDNVDAKVADLDMKGISDKANDTLGNVNDVVRDEKLKEAIANLDATLAEAKTLITGIDKDNINTALESAASAMEKAKSAAGNIANMTANEAPINVRLNRVLGEIENTARSVRQFMDFLKRNPNAIITGKKQP